MTTNPLEPDRHRMHEILERHRAELLALPEDALLRPQVLRERALELTYILLPNIRAFAPSFDTELHPKRAAERHKQVAWLEERALTFYAADLAAGGTLTETSSKRRSQLAKQVRKHDRNLFNWVTALFSEDKEVMDELERIRPGTGQKDDAEDTHDLVAILRTRWASISGQTALTMQQLDTADADAAELLQLMTSGESNPAGDLARRAYTAWCRDYRELQMLGRYLDRDNPKAAQRFPGVHAAAGSPSSRADDSADTPADEPTPSDSEAPDTEPTKPT